MPTHPILHGPYNQWTRTVNGKTVTKFLTNDQLARYQPWFDNAHRLKELIAMLQTASVHAVEQHEGWTTPARRDQPAPPQRALVHGTDRRHPGRPPRHSSGATPNSKA